MGNVAGEQGLQFNSILQLLYSPFFRTNMGKPTIKSQNQSNHMITLDNLLKTALNYVPGRARPRRELWPIEFLLVFRSHFLLFNLIHIGLYGTSCRVHRKSSPK